MPIPCFRHSIRSMNIPLLSTVLRMPPLLRSPAFSVPRDALFGPSSTLPNELAAKTRLTSSCSRFVPVGSGWPLTSVLKQLATWLYERRMEPTNILPPPSRHTSLTDPSLNPDTILLRLNPLPSLPPNIYSIDLVQNCNLPWP